MTETEGYRYEGGATWTGSLVADGLTPWQNALRLVRELVKIVRGGVIVLETWIPHTAIRVRLELHMRQGHIDATWNIPAPVLEIAREWWEQNHHILN